MKIRWMVVAVLLIVSLIGSAGLAQESATQTGPDGMKWEAQFAYDMAVLVVSGPDGLSSRYEYGPDDALYYAIRDGSGDILPDGGYNYELTFAPSMSDQAQTTLARAVGEGASREEIVAQLGAAGQLPDRLPVISGHFRISDGALVSDQGMESEPAKEAIAGDAGQAGGATLQDVLHYDDVIVTGSLCVGFDCADGESFGFDTQILKEHNLRIYFNDTSYTGSYPTNSWRITINDSTNGGASYFSVDDVDDGTSIFKIEAGAPSNSLYVEDYGRVGLGTSTPVVELHIKDSDTPTMRLEQDSSGGWTAQTWDVAGNESNFFIRDATNGSKLPFRIQPGTPSSTMCLKSDGKVGIGTWSPEVNLEIESTNTYASLLLDKVGGTQARYTVGPNVAQLGTVTNSRFDIIVENTAVAMFSTDGNVTILGDLTVDGDIYKNGGTLLGQLDDASSGVGQDVLAFTRQLEAQDARILELETQNEDLLARLAAIESLLAELSAE